MKWMDNDKVIEWVLVFAVVFFGLQLVRAFLHWFLN
jgi:hypothetical protein